MKKVIVYLLAAGMGMTTIAMIPSTALASHRHHMSKEERREERRERKHNRYISMTNMNMNDNYYRMMWPQPALPVREGYVSPDVLSTFQNKYGASLYDVTPLKTVNGVDRYSVRMINNGVAEEIIVDGTGAPAL